MTWHELLNSCHQQSVQLHQVPDSCCAKKAAMRAPYSCLKHRVLNCPGAPVSSPCAVVTCGCAGWQAPGEAPAWRQACKLGQRKGLQARPNAGRRTWSIPNILNICGAAWIACQPVPAGGGRWGGAKQLQARPNVGRCYLDVGLGGSSAVWTSLDHMSFFRRCVLCPKALLPEIGGGVIALASNGGT